MMASKKTSKQKRDDGASELSIKTRSDLNAPPPEQENHVRMRQINGRRDK